jgi:hypothetical protein
MSDNRFTFYTGIVTAAFSVASAGLGAMGAVASNIGPKAFDWYTGETVPKAAVTNETLRANALQVKLDQAALDIKAAQDANTALDAENKQARDVVARLSNVVMTYNREAAVQTLSYKSEFRYPGTDLVVYLEKPISGGVLMSIMGRNYSVPENIPIGIVSASMANCTVEVEKVTGIGATVIGRCVATQ